jgi:hypothetical protein
MSEPEGDFFEERYPIYWNEKQGKTFTLLIGIWRATSRSGGKPLVENEIKAARALGAVFRVSDAKEFLRCGGYSDDFDPCAPSMRQKMRRVCYERTPEYRAIMAQIRALHRTHGYGTDVALMALIEPVEVELMQRAKALAYSSRVFESDMNMARKCKPKPLPSSAQI